MVYVLPRKQAEFWGVHRQVVRKNNMPAFDMSRRQEKLLHCILDLLNIYWYLRVKNVDNTDCGSTGWRYAKVSRYAAFELAHLHVGQHS